MLAESMIVATGFAMGAAAGYGMRLHKARRWERRWANVDEIAAERSRRVLDECCRQGTHAMIVNLASGNTSPARFRRVERDQVHCETTGEGGDQECWSKHALVAVQFNYDGRARMFVAPLTEATPGTDGATYLATALPRHIADNEARAAFRIDMAPDEQVEAVLVHNEREIQVTVTDASTTGMGFACDATDIKSIGRGDILEVRVSLGGKSIARAGVARRIQGRSLGIAFPVVLGENVPAEQEAYFELIRSLLDREAA